MSDQPPIAEPRAFPHTTHLQHVVEPRGELSPEKVPEFLSVLLDCDRQSLAKHSLSGERTIAGTGGSSSRCLRQAGGW